MLKYQAVTLESRLLETTTMLNAELYLVGGAVRDALLGLNVKDTDYVVTGANLEQLKSALETWARVDVVGASFGVLKVTFMQQTVDVALPRTERSTGVRHRDFEVSFNANLPIEADLARRDFTINAMARRLSDMVLIDPFNGLSDLQQRILRAVGKPSERFLEDPLRMLRLARFVAKLGFTVHPDTWTAAQGLAHLTQSVAPERIQQELLGLLAQHNMLDALRLLSDTGLLVQCIPEYGACIGFDQQNPHHHLSLEEHMFWTVQHASHASLETKLAALLHDIGKPQTQSFGADGIAHYHLHEVRSAELTFAILQRLRCSKELLESVVKLVRNHMRPPMDASQKALRKFVNDLGQHWMDALELRRADRLAHTPEAWDSEEWLSQMRQRCNGFPPELAGFDERHLALSGQMIAQRFGLVGSEIGRAKKAAASAIIDGDLENSPEALERWLAQFLRS
ncbi:MAG: CCA tRNA nucleotidyltransferase [Deinococcales bacterium]